MKPKSEKVLLTNCKLYATVSAGVVCLLLATAISFLDPVNRVAKYRARLSPGSAIYDLLLQEFESVHVSVYLFNITNGERFAAGQDLKLKVEEIGPFTYRENRVNTKFQLDPEAGLVRYTPVVSLTFVPEESVGDPRDHNVTVPNLALLGLTTMLTSYSYVIRAGFNLLIAPLKAKSTINLSVHDYFWGFKDPLISLANTFMPHWIYFDKLGLLDRIYEQRKNRELVLRGKDTDKLLIKSMDGVEGLSAWGYEDPNKRSRCNSFVNVYEGVWYPNDMTPDKPIRIYRNALCRFVDLEYVGSQKTDYGSDVLVYQIKNDTYALNENNRCLCEHGMCVDGITDISPCYYDLPLAISSPHFTGANPALRDRIEGLTPDPEKYKSRFLVEPILGMALGTDFSVQVNLVAGDLGFNAAASPFSKMVVPIGYLKLTQPPLPQLTKDQLTLLYVTAPRALLATTIVLCLVGLVLLVYSTWLLYCNSQHSERYFSGSITDTVFKEPAEHVNAETPLTSDCDKLP